MMNMRARKTGIVESEPTRQKKVSWANSGIDPSAISKTPPVLASLQMGVWSRGKTALGSMVAGCLRRKDTGTKVSVNGMANRSLLRLVHQTMYARGGATGLRAVRGFESHRTLRDPLVTL